MITIVILRYYLRTGKYQDKPQGYLGVCLSIGWPEVDQIMLWKYIPSGS